MKWEKIISISAFIIVFSGLFSCKDIAFNNPLDPNASKDTVKVIRVLETGLTGKGDITFDGEKFWKSSLFGTLTAFDRESGSIIRSFDGLPATGIAFLDQSIYICYGERENTLFAIDPLSGDVANRISTQNIYPAFITVYGSHLLVFDLRSSGIFDYDPQSGNASRLFELSGLNIGGMALYKNGLLITDMISDSIFYFSITGDVQKVYSSPARGIGGVGVDSSGYVYFMMIDGKVYKVTLP